jgi:hypothetical protein
MIRLFTSSLALVLLTAACSSDIDVPDPDPDPAGECEQTAVPGVSGQGCVADRYTAEVAVQGDYAYTTTWGHRDGNTGNAIYVWDVRGPVPALIDSVLVTNATTLGDVQVSDDGAWLVVATEYRPGSIVVYDLANPRAPVEAARFHSANTDPGVHTAEVARVGGHLYGFLSVDPSTTSDAKLVMVDLANPRAPVEVASLTIGDPFVHDVFVRDGILFAAVWNEGVKIYDIGGGGAGGTVAAPVLLSTAITLGGAAHNVWWFHDPTTGSKRYAFVGEEQAGLIGSSSAGDIHVLDVADMAHPQEVAVYHLNDAGTHNFSMDEASGILYAAYYNRGVRAINVRGDLGSCTAAQKDAQGRCDLIAMGRENGHALADPVGSLDFYVWGVQYRAGFVYASDMLNGLWKLPAPLPH